MIYEHSYVSGDCWCKKCYPDIYIWKPKLYIFKHVMYDFRWYQME